MLDEQVVVRTEGTPARNLIRLAVIETESVWRLYMNAERIGRFTSRRDALRCALDVAHETRRDGVLVEVLAQDRFGELTLTEGAGLRMQPSVEGAVA
jgi:hypothetical protein